jgi:glutamate-ammonia-ligase adenylyltransferase
MEIDEKLFKELPDAESAKRFIGALAEKHPSHTAKLASQPALLSDVLALAAFSPLLTATMLQNPEYLSWLARKRKESGVRSTEELLESLARFALTNSTLEPQVLYARFRRRELLRIYLRDIRRLATVPEITEEISNLADVVLTSALDHARREMDNRYGRPQVVDKKGRRTSTEFCVAALGKLGSRELNYSSDIDLIFIYSDEGETAGGARGAITNREYFIKLAEHIVKLTGEQTGEGAAYRVDLRLRPHGRLGPLALSVADMIRYYKTEARAWERQVMIRSRGCAGNTALFRKFFDSVAELVFSMDESVESALANVRRSKEQIDKEQIDRRGYNVKLGRGGIREIEFIAQALQLAYGGADRWLRYPHTLVSLSRLADRQRLSEAELTGLAAAYEFLRRTEHILQMENGLQTHTLPDDKARRSLIARRVEFAGSGDFESSLQHNTKFVQSVFERVFGEQVNDTNFVDEQIVDDTYDTRERIREHVLTSIAKSDAAFDKSGSSAKVLERVIESSPHFASVLAANPQLATQLTEPDDTILQRDYMSEMNAAVESSDSFRSSIAAMRKTWHRLLIEIVVADIYGAITIAEAKRLQTELAEASIEAALKSASIEVAIDDIAILALGKLGGRGVDYDSDLDLIFVFDEAQKPRHDGSGQGRNTQHSVSDQARAVELFVTALSSMTRDGSLYRVDLRLRPYGSKGLTCISSSAFLEYMRETAVPWEMLAFVKLRAAGGNFGIAANIEIETRRTIHERALQLDPSELATETCRVRLALEQQRTRNLRVGEIDIKYGSGGLLDIYFAMRYLQLRDNVPDDGEDRSTRSMLDKLAASIQKSSTPDSPLSTLHSLADGHEFLTTLDHNIRLIAGRSTRLSQGNHALLDTIAKRMNLPSHAALLENLTLHRLAIRAAFDAITSCE